VPLGSVRARRATDGSVSACKEETSDANAISPEFVAVYRSREFRRQADSAKRRLQRMLLYGEYREPFYAIRDISGPQGMDG